MGQAQYVEDSTSERNRRDARPEAVQTDGRIDDDRAARLLEQGREIALLDEDHALFDAVLARDTRDPFVPALQSIVQRMLLDDEIVWGGACAAKPIVLEHVGKMGRANWRGSGNRSGVGART
jgi:hypothetical protein